ncbi:hypothetical protein MTsDn1_25260 [Alteromonas sp. MTD1]|uniref:hypothetical protein n=1 Tax=Alteromonas sp. MTD1 TaxID=3057962 RepID=UPI0036F1C65D
MENNNNFNSNTKRTEIIECNDNAIDVPKINIPWIEQIDPLSNAVFGDVETCVSFIKFVESKMLLHLHVYYDSDKLRSNRSAAIFLANIMSHAIVRSGTPLSSDILSRLSRGFNAYCYGDENFAAVSSDPIIDALFRSAYDLFCYADFFALFSHPLRDTLSNEQLVDLDKKFQRLLKHILSTKFIENLKAKGLLLYGQKTAEQMLSFEKALMERCHYALRSFLSNVLHLSPYDLLVLTLSSGDIKTHISDVRQRLKSTKIE